MPHTGTPPRLGPNGLEMKPAIKFCELRRQQYKVDFSNCPKTLVALLFVICLTAFPGIGNSQGTLTSGEVAYSTISQPGGSNYWTFTANAGDSIIVRVGALVLRGTNSLDPYIKLQGPDGTVLAQIGDYGLKAEEVSVRAANSGVFTAVIIAGVTAGDYRITLARTGAP